MIEETLCEIKQQLNIKRYSINTSKTYIACLKKFFYFHSTDPQDLTELDVKPFIRFLMELGLSHSTQNQAINAIKFYFEKVRLEPISVYYFDRPRQLHRLPNILSKSEVSGILAHIKNIKHRTMIALIYSCGMRPGELIRMQVRDIDSKRMTIKITQSKGNKDRMVPLSPKILDLLRLYYIQYKPKKYLFEGQAKESVPYSLSSLRALFKRAVKKAGIRKHVRLYTLRHSYATHLLETGISLRHIQHILGHNSSKTTEIYTQVSSTELNNIASPIDQII